MGNKLNTYSVALSVGIDGKYKYEFTQKPVTGTIVEESDKAYLMSNDRAIAKGTTATNYLGAYAVSYVAPESLAGSAEEFLREELRRVINNVINSHKQMLEAIDDVAEGDYYENSPKYADYRGDGIDSSLIKEV